MTNELGSSSAQMEEIDRVLMLLGAGIPLTLLLDLAIPIHSDEVYVLEPGAADWLSAIDAVPA
jgi:hypothetical protein